MAVSAMITAILVCTGGEARSITTLPLIHIPFDCQYLTNLYFGY